MLYYLAPVTNVTRAPCGACMAPVCAVYPASLANHIGNLARIAAFVRWAHAL